MKKTPDKNKRPLPKVPKVSFVCTDCKTTINWNKFDDGTPQCLRCQRDMVVDMSRYSGH